MPDEIRLFIAVALFCLGSYLTYDLFAAGFDFFVLISAVACFAVTHYVKPRCRTVDELSSVADYLDLVIDLPYRLIASGLRLLSKPFKGDADIIDL